MTFYSLKIDSFFCKLNETILKTLFLTKMLHLLQNPVKYISYRIFFLNVVDFRILFCKKNKLIAYLPSSKRSKACISI